MKLEWTNVKISVYSWDVYFFFFPFCYFETGPYSLLSAGSLGMLRGAHTGGVKL